MLSIIGRRAFSTSRTLLQETVVTQPAPKIVVKKRVGAFRGGMFGFLLGSSTAFVASFAYLRNEWKVRDEILMEDFAVLRATCQRVDARFRQVEEQLDKTKKN